MPTAAATICCSAMYISKNRSGAVFLKSSACVEFETSASSTTTSLRAARPCGRAARRAGFADCARITAVEDDRVDAKGADPRGIGAHVPFELGGAALTQPIHVDDRREIRKPFVTGVIEGLPDRTL